MINLDYKKLRVFVWSQGILRTSDIGCRTKWCGFWVALIGLKTGLWLILSEVEDDFRNFTTHNVSVFFVSKNMRYHASYICYMLCLNVGTDAGCDKTLSAAKLYQFFD